LSKESFDKETLIQYRLERSREALDDARLMFEENGSPAGVVNRAYYAMFYSTLAILMTIGKGSSKHQGVIALFDQHFIKTGIFPKELAKTLHRIFELRQVGDYRDLLVISKEQAKEVLESATEFTKALEEKIKNKK
jgi:uncharacterized protein (UPF0332 family)